MLTVFLFHYRGKYDEEDSDFVFFPFSINLMGTCLGLYILLILIIDDSHTKVLNQQIIL